MFANELDFLLTFSLRELIPNFNEPATGILPIVVGGDLEIWTKVTNSTTPFDGAKTK